MRALAAAALCGLLLAGPAPAADGAARVTAVTPARAGGLVVARLTTAGLPGEKLLQSMRSGLVSAVELDLALLDAGEDVLGGNQVFLHLGFDLWEEVFSVRADGAERRFRTLADLQAYLADLAGVPVAPAGGLAPDGRYRLRVALQLHPIAPAQQERVREVIAGGQPPRREGLDQQEAQVSLGRLIRLFYAGGGGGAGGQEIQSAWFTARELRDAAD